MKYKIKIRETQPLSFDVSGKFPDRCFLGISLSNPFFQGKHIERVLKWIDDNFKECDIVIADHLHRFNEYTFYGKDGNVAEAECNILGDEIHKRIQSIIDSMGSKKFKLNHWRAYTGSEEFERMFQNIHKYFENNSAFRESVINSCEEFIDKQIKRGFHISIERKEAINKSQEYLLEEMAVFSIMINRGNRVQVYPGTQLRVLKELANNKFPELDSILSHGIYIDLSIKKIK